MVEGVEFSHDLIDDPSACHAYSSPLLFILDCTGRGFRIRFSTYTILSNPVESLGARLTSGLSGTVNPPEMAAPPCFGTSNRPEINLCAGILYALLDFIPFTLLAQNASQTIQPRRPQNWM